MPGFYKTPDGQIVGPVSSLKIRELVQAGEVGLDTLISPTAQGPWKRLDQVPDLGGRRSSPATPPLMPRTHPRVDPEAQTTEVTNVVSRPHHVAVRALCRPAAKYILTVLITVVVVAATFRIVGSGRSAPVPAIAEGGPAAVDFSSGTEEIPQVARATFVWSARAGKLDKAFRASFDPVWKTTRESHDEVVLCGAYTRAAHIIGDFTGQLEAISSDTLDPELVEYIFENLAFWRRLQANCLALARSVSKIRQLKNYAQSPEAIANSFAMGLAGDPSGGSGRLVQLQLDYANEYNALVDQQTAFAGEQAKLEERRVRVHAGLKSKYGKYSERLEQEVTVDEE